MRLTPLVPLTRHHGLQPQPLPFASIIRVYVCDRLDKEEIPSIKQLQQSEIVTVTGSAVIDRAGVTNFSDPYKQLSEIISSTKGHVQIWDNKRRKEYQQWRQDPLTGDAVVSRFMKTMTNNVVWGVSWLPAFLAAVREQNFVGRQLVSRYGAPNRGLRFIVDLKVDDRDDDRVIGSLKELGFSERTEEMPAPSLVKKILEKLPIERTYFVNPLVPLSEFPNKNLPHGRHFRRE